MTSAAQKRKCSCAPRVVFIPSASKRADEAFSREALPSPPEPRRLRTRLRRGRPRRRVEPKSFTDVLDLTQPLYEGFPTFGGDKWFTKEPFLTYAKDKLNINKWTLMEHTGTHMDAPLHFSADGIGSRSIPVSDLVVPLAVIDI